MIHPVLGSLTWDVFCLIEILWIFPKIPIEAAEELWYDKSS